MNQQFSLGVITFNKNQHYSNEIKELVPFFIELNKKPIKFEPLITIWKYIYLFKPDILHTWDSLSTFYSLLPARLTGARIIDGSIRDAGIEKGWQYRFKKFFLNRADLVIANSKAGLSAYKAKGVVLYNAISAERFIKSGELSEINVVMVANFTDYKDHHTFLQAMVKLLKNKSIDHVYLLGDGKYRSKLQEWLESNHSEISNLFLFTGSVKNVEQFLSQCNIGVLCSTETYKEGISNSVLEYMASGLLAIATDVGGINEIIRHGVNGFLVQPGNYDEIVSIITRFKNQEFDMAGIKANAEETIQEKFNINANLTKLIEIYKSMVQ